MHGQGISWANHWWFEPSSMEIGLDFERKKMFVMPFDSQNRRSYQVWRVEFYGDSAISADIAMFWDLWYTLPVKGTDSNQVTLFIFLLFLFFIICIGLQTAELLLWLMCFEEYSSEVCLLKRPVRSLKSKLIWLQWNTLEKGVKARQTTPSTSTDLWKFL